MQLFVSEFLSSGAWPQPDLDISLAVEGKSMLLAVIEDFSQIPNCRILTTWDKRLGDFPEFDKSSVTAIEVSGPEEERQVFQKYAKECDATLIIAPEFDNILAERCRLVDSLGGRTLGCSLDAIELCGDKLQTATHLSQYGLPVVETTLPEPDATFSKFDIPRVVKPRQGAGSQLTFRVASQRELNNALEEIRETPLFGPPIVQPFIEGESLSVAAIVSTDGERIDVFPLAEQRLSTDGRFRYLGGRMPVFPQCQPAVEQLVRQACRCIDGLAGYVGFDLILPLGDTENPIIVEINPRLTTSYLGYRQIAAENLAARMWFPERFQEPVRWKSCEVQFSPDGTGWAPVWNGFRSLGSGET